MPNRLRTPAMSVGPLMRLRAAIFLELFDLTLERLAKAGAHPQLSKCEIAPKSFDYLVHNIWNGMRTPLKIGTLKG